MRFSPGLCSTPLLVACALLAPALLYAQTPPRDTSKVSDSTRRVVTPRLPADTDSTRRTNALGIPGIDDLPIQLNLRTEAKGERDRNLSCNTVENAQSNILTGCRGGFIPGFDAKAAIKASGTIGRVNVNIDYDMQREFDASNSFSLSYQGQPGSHLQRVDVGNITFAPPSSRFITPSLPAGNYGLQTVNQFGNLQVRSIFARQTGNVVQDRHYTMGARSEQPADREIEDRQIEPRRFFFTVDPALFGRAYPNIDILNRGQLASLRNALPDTLRPTRVLVYRLQFGAQPQNPNGPRFRIQGDSGGGAQTYDLLREGVDYYLDQSQLWIALARPLVESNERLVVAYNVRLHGRDTVWTTTGGTPDDRLVASRVQVANLVWEPNLSQSSPAFQREIRSVYRIAGEELVRSTARVRVVTGSGQLEHPIVGTDATFLQMFGLSQSMNPGEFDYTNRIWPRLADALNLGIGAPDVRNATTAGIGRVIRDQFLVFPSLRPFAERGAQSGGLVVTGNPTNELIYTTPGEYLFSPQHPASVYRIHLQYSTAIADEPGSLTLGATQMRPGSERVVLDKRVLTRDLDYKIDYDLGRIDFMRPDTLFHEQRQVDVRYEENPGFASSQTTFAGIVSELPVSHGVLNFTAINQSQGTAATRPQLGFQSSSSLTTGVSGQFNWTAPALSRLVGRLPFANSNVESRISLQGEIASSHPQFGAGGSGEAFVDGFDGTGGTSIPLADISWYYSSLPAYGHSLQSSFGPDFFELKNAATLAWQTNAHSVNGHDPIVFKQSEIDPLTALIGTGFEPNEPVLWLSLLPTGQAGQFNRTTRQYDWTVASAPTGRRFRSIRTVLSPSGIDLSQGQFLQFWTLVDTTIAGSTKNGTLIFDFGDVSENSLVFSPETLTVKRNAAGGVDSLFTGKRIQGFDSLNTERDPFSHAFNYEVNDKGLPGDVVDSLVVIDGVSVRRELNAHICRGSLGALEMLGDPRANCTYGNFRLDEEDIDLDGAMNFRSQQRESERLLRYVVDLSQPSIYKRLGGTVRDSVLVRGVAQPRTRRWALISIPLQTPTDSLNAANRRRVRALRLTVVSGKDPSADDEPMQIPLAMLTVTGAPWLNRSVATLAGIGGVHLDGGFVVTSGIGTNDSSATLVYQPPPGVINEADTKGAQFGSIRVPINERSMRIQAGNLQLYHRAEAYFRFPSGPQFYQGFQQLRVWGRGRGNGWGQNGDLQMFVKVGRDENNFYLYRTPISAGSTPAAWTDLPIDFARFINLRKKIQTEYLAGKKESITCTGTDSAIIAVSPLPIGVVSHRFAACDDGYMVYTVDPAVTAPNLAAVQELAVGFIRTGTTAGSAILPADTLELWVDDIRLARPVNASGIASQVSFGMNAADLGDLHINIGNRDPQFRQLGEQPTFLSERNVDVVGTINLDRLLPRSFGLALPLTVNKASLANDPLYLSQTDIPGVGIPGLRKPRNDVTTYSLTVHRSTPVNAGMLGALVNNLSATTSYVSGVDRTEYQDGNARNFSFALDYLVADDSARTLMLPGWSNGAFGGKLFRWNPTQLRLTSGLVRASDRRVSFIKPADAVDDQPSVSNALSRLWRNGSVLEFRPTNGLIARWEVQSVRDLRDYGDTTALTAVTTRARQNLFGANAGFERERSMLTSLSWQPSFSTWLRPRAEIGTQYNMLRDPNDRSLIPLPGVVGVDSVLAARDSLALASSLTLPRRLTAAQTSSVGTSIDIARAFSLHTGDSTFARRFGGRFTPIDVSYTRSLLTAVDATPVNAPLSLQFGLGGPNAFRTVSGVTATTAGQTGVLSASGSVLLPFGASLVNRFSRTTTANWIDRLDATPAQVDGSQRQFPDVALRWGYRPTVLGGVVTNVDASAGFVRSDATVSLPSFADDIPDEVRHTYIQTFPIAGAIAWAGRGRLSTGAKFSFRRQIDSLPGSVAQTRGNDLSLDAGRVFFIPASWQLGIHDDLRTRISYQETHNTTSVFDENGGVRARLQDNGRQAFTLTADSNINEFVVLTLNGSHIVTFDNNLNRRFAYTVFSTVFQIQFFGAGK